MVSIRSLIGVDWFGCCIQLGFSLAMLIPIIWLIYSYLRIKYRRSRDLENNGDNPNQP